MEWIDVKDRLPEKDQDVLIYGYTRYNSNIKPHFKIDIGFIWKDEWELQDSDIEEVISWMPLREPPKE